MLVNRAVMDVFQSYQGHRIPRLAYFSGVNKMVELHPLAVRISINIVFIHILQSLLAQARAREQR